MLYSIDMYETLTEKGMYRGFKLFRDESSGDWTGELDGTWFGSTDDPKDIIEVKAAIDAYWRDRQDV
jgi:hypothetical protein